MGNENLNWLFSTEDCNIALSKSLYQVPLDACYKCGGNTILRSRDHRILIGIDHAALGFGTIAAHGHADALSFQMYVNQQYVGMQESWRILDGFDHLRKI